RDLSASTFHFVTSVCVLNSRTQYKSSAVGTSEITFRELTDAEINHYIRTHEVLRYAGAFESNAVLRFSERICGSYNFVTAIPMSQFVILLRAHGVAV
ncbi:MAG: Maf family protein, partial [Acidobacteriaceae bacterium]|nr:Maf family protein [Acidobacteriaceae bacterium]